ncbi:recombinase [Sinorhizobium meliloti]|uniref:recombinase n=1 Tax=Rhizobium meliloti TaxID=382 RepID=UPI000415AF77|nr:recombinase [Sinorhizobium meliloti]
MAALAGNLRAVWAALSTDARLKKRIVRTVIHEVIADLDDVTSEIVLVIHWVGGVHTQLRLPKRHRGQRNATPDDLIEAVRQLALIANDDVIAGVLNRNGLLTGNGNLWTRERVTALRSYRKIPVFRPQPDGIEPWLNLGNAARFLGIAAKTLRLAAEAGEIEGVHPLAEGPRIFRRSKLTTQQAQQIADRARQNPRYPAGSHQNQKSLFPSIT